MYIVDGIAYAGEITPEIEVTEAVTLNDLMLLLTFSTGEKRLYDASSLLEYQAFKPLADLKTFESAKVEHGIVTWLNGNIDIAPETLYKHSIAYQEAVAYS